MDANFTTPVLTTGEANITSDEFASRLYERIMIPPVLVASLYICLCSLLYQKRGNKRTDVLKLTNRLVSIAAVFSLLGPSVIAPDIFLHSVNSTWCVASNILRYTFLVVVRITVFTVLWLRQKNLNNSITFNSEFVKRTIAAIRYATLTLVPVSQVTFLVIATSRGTAATIRGCEFTGEVRFGPLATSTLIFTLSQVSALVLSIAPLTLRIGDEQVRKTIVRISVSTATVLVSDILYLAVASMFTEQIGQWAYIVFFPLIFQYIQVFYVLCLIFTFRDYHTRLNPLRSKNKVANKENCPVTPVVQNSTTSFETKDDTVTNNMEEKE